MGRALRLTIIVLLVNILAGHAASSADPRNVARTPQQPREVVPSADGYTCVMHPEVRTAKPGKCPKCQMTLVPVTPDNPDAFDLRMESVPRAPKPNEPLKLRFAIFNPKTGQQVKDFQLTHDKLYHLFIVSQDMSEFQHIHPVLQSDGSFTIETRLPRAGLYKIYSDFYPSDGTPQVLQQHIATAGYKPDLVAATARLVADTTFTKTVDGLQIELKLEPEELIAGQPVALKYHLTDAKTGAPVRDLVPYLGAMGHTLILSEDQADYVHSHPEEEVAPAADRSKLRGGPDVTFNAFLPRPGTYRVWTQFQRGERLTTVSFTIHADQLK
ncbi:MAG TPA: heavy metal-binding domain-containing protein [Blastocatellia bacterium]|nr:heavy metal-binding domain-containing protein [Blastocatellia bacterium]